MIAMSTMFERMRDRGPAIAAVVALHVALLVGIGAQRMTVQHNATPIVVDFLETVSDARPKMSPPPAVKIERTMPTVVAPELPVLAPAQWEVAAAPLAVAPPVQNAPPVDREPIIEARFDADYLNNPSPSYPPLSRRLREQGMVVLRVRVLGDGHAAEVMVHQRSGHPRLDEAALSAVRKWRFVPARRGDAVIESWVFVPIEFSLNS